MSDKVYNQDDPNRKTVFKNTGRVVRNLSAEEYNATYDRPGTELHGVPQNVIDDLVAELDAKEVGQ